MGRFENTLDRMKALYTYGKDINESKKVNSYSLEHKATAADGITYGIIRECNKYYIKKAQPGKEAIAESYQYLGGFCNKGNYEYDSYNKAVKNFELKLASINEACDGNVTISTLDPFKKGEFIVEGTERMRDVIARQRQIMHNVSMIMNESSTIGATHGKDGVVMFDGKNPEAKTGKRGDEGMTTATAKPDYAGSKTKGVDKKVGPFNENPGKCEDQLKESCECGEDGCSCDWGSEGIGKGRDPKQIGWEMEGQTIVNEEEQDWASAGLPSTPGVGEADTDHNNGLFTNAVNEGEEFDDEDNVEVDTTDDTEDFDVDADDETEDFDVDADDETEDFDMDTDDIDLDTEDMPEEEGDEDIMARIAELEAELEALKAQVGGDEFDTEDGEEFDIDTTEDDMDIDATEGGEDVSDFETDFDTIDDAEFESEPEEESFEGEESFEDEMDECGDMSLMEAKNAYMNRIVESVVAKMINEDELHVFGKHPGYQKKPMELPTTGEDNNQWGEDWNDESVYSEEPFGTKIGSSAPFDKLVDTITKDVMSQISGEAFKKKVK
jgi:hypothetical protein